MNKKQCNIDGCENPVWSKGVCAYHLPKKKMNTKRNEVNSEKISKMRKFFLEIWKTRPHVSEITGISLGSQPLTIYFHHILPKEKYPEAMYDEENIVLLSGDEHGNVESDMYRYEYINSLRNYLKTKYDL
jgi:hypothetical protein